MNAHDRHNFNILGLEHPYHMKAMIRIGHKNNIPKTKVLRNRLIEVCKILFNNHHWTLVRWLSARDDIIAATVRRA
tara:strand:- start:68048 stop:68275 length:228 start_codon:yes stop_codon:yes gene_type:complete